MLNNHNIIHLVGTDILRTHTVYWPAFLITYNYIREEIKNMNEVGNNISKFIPAILYAHGLLTNEG